MSHIVALFWLTIINEIYCNVLLDHRNIRVLAALYLAIVALHKPNAINIPFCGILQQQNIKPPQYISFSGISVTYSGRLDDRHNKYFFAVLFLSYSGGLDRHNRPF